MQRSQLWYLLAAKAKSCLPPPFFQCKKCKSFCFTTTSQIFLFLYLTCSLITKRTTTTVNTQQVYSYIALLILTVPNTLLLAHSLQSRFVKNLFFNNSFISWRVSICQREPLPIFFVGAMLSITNESVAPNCASNTSQLNLCVPRTHGYLYFSSLTLNHSYKNGNSFTFNPNTKHHHLR